MTLEEFQTVPVKQSAPVSWPGLNMDVNKPHCVRLCVCVSVCLCCEDAQVSGFSFPSPLALSQEQPLPALVACGKGQGSVSWVSCPAPLPYQRLLLALLGTFVELSSALVSKGCGGRRASAFLHTSLGFVSYLGSFLRGSVGLTMSPYSTQSVHN